MKRREFLHRNSQATLALSLAGGCAAAWMSPALAQGAPFAEGRDYRRLGAPAPVPGHGKIDVVEFFWYGCPHCHARKTIFSDGSI